jgi:hypothetical protein
MKLSKELLKEIYEFVDENLKAKIQNEVPEMKPKLEYNRWLKDDNHPNWLWGYDNEGNVYGFDSNVKWIEIKAEGNPNSYNNRYATHEEAETALVNEAKRRGFKEGVKCVSLIAPEGKETLKSNFVFEFYLNRLWVYSNKYKCCIFKNGIWATIITEPNEKELLIDKANKVEAELIELKKQIEKLS